MFRALFSPRLVGVHLLGVVATTIAVLLGLWQYDGWQASRELEARDLANVAPRPLDEVMSADQPFPGDAMGRPVTVQGTWLEGETFYVSGRERDDRLGYWVVTPLAVDAVGGTPRGPAVLVVRGWNGEPASPAEPRGTVEVTGWLQPSEASGRPDADRRDDVIPEMRVASVVQRLDQDLYSAYVVAEEVSTGSTTGDEAAATAGLAPVTPDSLPEPATSTGLRNLLYALEWWVFAAFAGFLWWRWVRDEVVATGSTTTGGGGSAPEADDPPGESDGSAREGDGSAREGDGSAAPGAGGTVTTGATGATTQGGLR